MLMANKNVHVFDNTFDKNQTTHVMVIAYSNAFDDARYNPLPRDFVIRDNTYGEGGNDPQGRLAPLAKALGGKLPPIVWDGVTKYGEKATRPRTCTSSSARSRKSASSISASSRPRPTSPRPSPRRAPGRRPDRRAQAGRNAARARQGRHLISRLAFAFVALVLAACSAQSGPNTRVILADEPAPKLSDYHLFDTPNAGAAISEGVVPYDLVNALFSDHAAKHRYVYVPKGQSATYNETEAFDFPVGSVLIKTFAFAPDMRDPALDERFDRNAPADPQEGGLGRLSLHLERRTDRGGLFPRRRHAAYRDHRHGGREPLDRLPRSPTATSARNATASATS